MIADAVAVRRAAQAAEWWLAPGSLLVLLFLLPLGGLIASHAISIVAAQVAPLHGIGLALALSPVLATIHLAFRLLRQAAGGWGFAALTWGCLALLALDAAEASLSGLQGAPRISGVIGLAPLALALPFLAAWRPLLAAARPGTPERARLARRYGLCMALLGVILLAVAGAIWEVAHLARLGLGREASPDPAGLQRAAATLILAGLPAGLALCLAAPSCGRAMAALLPSGIGEPDVVRDILRNRVADAIDVDAEEPLGPWNLRLRGQAAGAAVQADIELTPAPVRVVVRCEIQGLEPSLSVAIRREGERPGARLADPVLASALRAEGAGEDRLAALFQGLNEDLLSVLAPHPGARIAGGWLIVPVPGPPDEAAANLTERVRDAARLAAALAERARKPLKEAEVRRSPAHQPVGA